MVSLSAILAPSNGAVCRQRDTRTDACLCNIQHMNPVMRHAVRFDTGLSANLSYFWTQAGRRAMDPYLRQLDIFEGVGCDGLRAITEVVIERWLEPGTLVFSAREEADYVYMIRQGGVRLYRLDHDGREIVIALLGPGDIFGEFVFGEQLTHSVFAQTFKNTLLCLLPRDGFFSLLAREPGVAAAIVDNIGRRLAGQAMSVEMLGTLDVERRFCKLLLCLADRFGEDLPDLAGGHRILTIVLTHEEQANMIASCRQTITRVLGELRRSGLVSFRGRQMVVDVPGIRDFLEGQSTAIGRRATVSHDG